jgi:hypothetical protein
MLYFYFYCPATWHLHPSATPWPSATPRLRHLPRSLRRPPATRILEMTCSKYEALLPSVVSDVAVSAHVRISPAPACSVSLRSSSCSQLLSTLSSSLPEQQLHAHSYNNNNNNNNNNAYPTPPRSIAASFTTMHGDRTVLAAEGTTLSPRNRHRSSTVQVTSQSRRMSLASQTLSSVLTRTVVTAHISRPVIANPHPPDCHTSHMGISFISPTVIVAAG